MPPLKKAQVHQRDPFTLDLFSATTFPRDAGTLFTSSLPCPAPHNNPAGHKPPSISLIPPPPEPTPPAPSADGNFFLFGNRNLATGWKARAHDNLEAIQLASEIDRLGRLATPEEQAKLIRFTGFGASDLANSIFRRPGETEFRRGWEQLGADLQDLVDDADYASLMRCTQYAHYTPEFIIRAIWSALVGFGWRGGHILEPGLGTGLFPALMPQALSSDSLVTGIELDPATARIARLLQPRAHIINDDFTHVDLPAHFDLAIGNPPFSDRIIRSDSAYRSLKLRLHDYFIARSVDLLKPGALAAFVTSRGTMDKADATAREHIAKTADLIAAIRLPEGAFRADAGTDVVVDILFFQKRPADAPHGDASWIELENVPYRNAPNRAFAVNAWFARHPEFVLGSHALTSGPFGETYTCQPTQGEHLENALQTAVAKLPRDLYTGVPEDIEITTGAGLLHTAYAIEKHIREGSYLLDDNHNLMQIVNGAATPVITRAGRTGAGFPEKHVRIIKKLIPIRDAVRDILKAQETDQPWQDAQDRLHRAWNAFIQTNGPINHTKVISYQDAATGELRETHKRPNLQPFLDDPDCWLVASIENYDLDSNTAKPGPIFTNRVIAPPATAIINTAADALAVVLNERGMVDIDHICELLHRDADSVIEELHNTIFRDPEDGNWKTADAYLSGPVRKKLVAAMAAAETDPSYERNIPALEAVQPADLRPSDITARLGAPWIPVPDIVSFIKETMDANISIYHTPEVASWTVHAQHLSYRAACTTEWGTRRRHAGQLLGDALNNQIPQIFDTVRENGSDKRILNVTETEAAKEKLQKIKAAFQNWIWTNPERTERLARIYNDKYNDIAPRHFDGSHLILHGASQAFNLYPHQKRGIWRIITAGSTYLAHAVGAGKTITMAAAVMEQIRLGLIAKAMIVVPGHCLAQAAREFLALYPTARILVADETNFTKDKRQTFMARAATANWDAIIITHSAFGFISIPSAFEKMMISDEISVYDDLLSQVDDDDRVSLKRLQRLKEGLQDRLERLATRKDDLLSIAEIGVDQIIVDEAQEFRKLSFATNMSSLRGIDPNGSQRAWDLYVKTRFIETKNPTRALVLASGTPITNTIGEMFTAQRFLGYEALVAGNLHEFDAWASAFGDTTTELELQPSGKYKPVTRFSTFVNVPELIAMFRTFADVILPEDLRQYAKIPTISTGKRQILTAKPTPAFKEYQRQLEARIKAIENRSGPAKKGDDILLSVITDGRHAAIDLRLVDQFNDNEPNNKLNMLINRAFDIWQATADKTYLQEDGAPYELPGATQMIFSDLGTIAVAKTRGFSAYRWIRDELVRKGVPANEIAYIQDYKKSEAKQRLFAALRSGKIRFVLGSSNTMGTGVNAQLRLKALHHLDVPWLPSQIEQREGRIARQGNQNDEIDIYAYATEGSLDATMWQNNERKARFILAALSGDTSIRKLDDADNQANQFAMAKAIASGNPLLMQKAGLEAEIGRLERLRAAHHDEQFSIFRQIRNTEREIEHAIRRIAAIDQDIARLIPTAGPLFAMTVTGVPFIERKPAGQKLMKEIVTLQRLKQHGQKIIASIGGFDLKYYGESFGRDAYHYTITLVRTDDDYRLDIPPTAAPLGAISRLEHALTNFDLEKSNVARRLAHAQDQLPILRSHHGGEFAFANELTEKLHQLAEIDQQLAADDEQQDETKNAA